MGHLIDQGKQSATIKSYVSTIEKMLLMDGYDWNENLVLVRSLAKACKIINNGVITRLHIHCGLLEIILFEVQRMFFDKNQWYLKILYKCIFIISYYGLIRIGEVTFSPYILRAKDVHVAKNKNKILLILCSSKTHDKSSRLQKIKITANQNEKSAHYSKRHFCTFETLRKFISIRKDYEHEEEKFVISRDGSRVWSSHMRTILNKILSNIGLDSTLYGMHSFRIGQTTDLIKYKYTIEEAMRMGRWRSNVVFKYIR